MPATCSIRNYFKKFPKALWVLAGAAFINFLGYMALPFLILYFTRTLGFSIGIAGILMSIYGLGNIVGAWLGGYLSDKLGPQRVLFMSFLLSGAFLVLLTLSASVIFLSVSLTLLAFANGAFRPAYDSCVVRICPEKERSQAYAVYVVAINVGAAIGTATGGHAFSVWPPLVFWIDGAASFLAAIWVVLLVPRTINAIPLETMKQKTEDRSQLSPLVDKIFIPMCLSVLTFEFIAKQSSSTLPLYMTEQYGLSPEYFGRVLTLGHLLFAGLMLPITAWAKSQESYRIAAIGALVLSFGYGILPLGTTTVVAIALYVVTVAGQIFFYPAVISIVMGHAAKAAGRSGSYMGLYRSFQAIAGIAAPAFGTWVYATQGPSALWFGCGILGFTVAVYFGVKK